MKQTALIITPGRGTYNKDELGYLRRHHAGKRELIAAVTGNPRNDGEIMRT